MTSISIQGGVEMLPVATETGVSCGGMDHLASQLRLNKMWNLFIYVTYIFMNYFLKLQLTVLIIPVEDLHRVAQTESYTQ